jgi:hypothetical protein
MNAWEKVLQEVNEVLSELNENACPDPFFRGHADSKWQLISGLERIEGDLNLESRLYHGFISMGGHLFPEKRNTWDILFLMQHHGLPTRLLDWSENFAVALYFALKGCESEGAVWILNPYAMNHKFYDLEEVIFLEEDFPNDYFEYFINDRSEVFGKFPSPALAVAGGNHSTRMRSQRGVFTIHRELQHSLESLCPDVMSKIIIPEDALPEAKQFLRLAGINEYTLFPDLDGLSRYLITEEIEF